MKDDDEYKDDQFYFDIRSDEYAYISQVFTGRVKTSREKRFVQKKFNFNEELKLEKTQIKGEYLIRSSQANRIQLKALLTQDNQKIFSIIIQSFNGSNPKPESVSLHSFEFQQLVDFLSKIKFIDFSNKERFKLRVADIDAKKVLVTEGDDQLIELIKTLKDNKKQLLLDTLSNEQLTREDLNMLSGRKKGLEEFKKNLFEINVWDEKEWQTFFNNNTWIFGYGLDYKFFQILQKEPRVSGVDLDGKNTVTADFLLGTNKFTVLVELKRPDTPLFNSSQNRAETWDLSNDLTRSVSQILIQKAEWEIKSRGVNFDSKGNPIKQNTFDPKTILVIGSSKQFDGETKDATIKAKTFELYRRNSRNIKIITYTELYERAYFIVNQTNYEEK